MKIRGTRWLRRTVVAATAVTALALASPALAIHLPGFGHTVSHPAGNRTPVNCNLDDWCFWVDNINAGNSAVGVIGRHTAGSGLGAGVQGSTSSNSTGATGVYGTAGGTGTTYAVYGNNSSTGASAVGVKAQVADDGYGVYSSTGPNGWALYGTAPGAFGIGVYGIHSDATGTLPGVRGRTSSTADLAAGVLGEAPGAGSLVAGVYGNAASGIGAIGIGGNIGVVGYNPMGLAGYFEGNVHVQGTLSKSAGSFRIDHPLEPKTKYLQHSFVESPDMMNVYNGNIRTDAKGFATVKLPRYFGALNRDFRYQLTIVGSRGWRARVVEKIQGNRFRIQTDQSRVEVSWQVTGIRKDRYANANRIQPEIAKSAVARGPSQALERLAAKTR